MKSWRRMKGASSCSKRIDVQIFQVKAPSSLHIALSCGAVAALALWSSVNFYAETATLVTPGADVYKVGDQAVRFEELMSQIPETAVIGYVSDLPITDTVGAALYSSAQYTLARVW